jgi:hypothetical protein
MWLDLNILLMTPLVLVQRNAFDEIQKMPNWLETVKRLWDEDTRRKLPLKVILLGSAPLPIARGMTESLAGTHERHGRTVARRNPRRPRIPGPPGRVCGGRTSRQRRRLRRVQTVLLA